VWWVDHTSLDSGCAPMRLLTHSSSTPSNTGREQGEQKQEKLTGQGENSLMSEGKKEKKDM